MERTRTHDRDSAQAAAVKGAIALAVFMAAAPQPIRPSAGSGVMVLQAGVGADSCERWTAARHAGGWGSGEQWILGFVSGVSATGGVTHLAPLAETNVDGVFAWIDSYCQAHPAETLAHTGLEFVAAHPG
jgi:hypothetical protein